jgi:uncharacterized protein YbjT (DUF2867 family)
MNNKQIEELLKQLLKKQDNDRAAREEDNRHRDAQLEALSITVANLADPNVTIQVPPNITVPSNNNNHIDTNNNINNADKAGPLAPKLVPVMRTMMKNCRMQS